MKNFFLCLLITGLIFSCDKKENASTPENYDEGAVAVELPTQTAGIFREVEFSPEKMTDFLAAKNNDTLYVTNFFATWCGPCIREIPHFKEKMAELKGQPVKWTFVSLDQKNDWTTDVKNFAEEQQLTENVVLLDGALLTEDFYKKNYKNWDGSGIPFTFMRKGSKTDEYMSMMTKEQLEQKIASFGLSKQSQGKVPVSSSDSVK